MIDAMFQEGTDKALDDMVQRPRAPAPPEAPGFFTGLASAAPRGIGGAAAKMLAFGSEIAGAFGDVMGAYPEANGVPLTDEQRKQGEAARRKLLAEGPRFSNEAGDMFRLRAKDILPDPNTTGMAGQLVSGLFDFGAQAVGYGLTTGPAMPLALGMDVAMTESDRLKQQGVGLGARSAAGAAAGALAGGSMVVPLTGATALIRGLKGVAVGESAIVGTSLAEKAILKAGGYDKLADTFDPLDPVAWGMGLVPGALGARFGGKPAKPVGTLKTEADVRVAAVLTPAEQAVSDAFERSPGNLRELQKAIDAQKDPGNKAVLQAELDKQVKAATQADPDLVPAARVMQTVAALDRSRLTPDGDLAGMDAHVRAVEAAMDQIGRGERVDVADILAAS